MCSLRLFHNQTKLKVPHSMFNVIQEHIDILVTSNLLITASPLCVFLYLFLSLKEITRERREIDFQQMTSNHFCTSQHSSYHYLQKTLQHKKLLFIFLTWSFLWICLLLKGAAALWASSCALCVPNFFFPFSHAWCAQGMPDYLSHTQMCAYACGSIHMCNLAIKSLQSRPPKLLLH